MLPGHLGAIRKLAAGEENGYTQVPLPGGAKGTDEGPGSGGIAALPGVCCGTRWVWVLLVKEADGRIHNDRVPETGMKNVQ
jgi:hypothetical protein